MISPLKHFFKSRPRLYDSAKRLKTFIGYSAPYFAFFWQYSRFRADEVTFVQIGASDGIHADPIRYFILRFHWTGVLVEPLPEVFEQLKRNYACYNRSNLSFVNAAISSESGRSLKFWTLEESVLSNLSDADRIDYLQKASFNLEQLKKLLRSKNRPFSEKSFEQISVRGMTINELVQEHCRDRKVDLVVIDAEGHEPDIILNIDFTVLQPDAIYFEIQNLEYEVLSSIINFLDAHDYVNFEIEGGDAIAIRSSILDALALPDQITNRKILPRSQCRPLYTDDAPGTQQLGTRKG
jgi:FkbM family methyltransferase